MASPQFWKDWGRGGVHIALAWAPSKSRRWLTVGAVLKLAGKATNPGERYRPYCEKAVRCRLSIRELSERTEIEYVSAATALRRFSERGSKERRAAKLLHEPIAE